MLIDDLILLLIEPILEAVDEEVVGLCVDIIVRERDESRVLDVDDLEGQPSAVSSDVGEELGFITGGAEGGDPFASFFVIAISGSFADLSGCDEGLHGVEFARRGDGIDLIEVDESVFRDAQFIVLIEIGVITHLTFVGAQVRWQEIVEPGCFEDALRSDEYEYLMVDDFGFEPRGDHTDEPFLEAMSPEALCVLVPFDGDTLCEPIDPVCSLALVGIIINMVRECAHVIA